MILIIFLFSISFVSAEELDNDTNMKVNDYDSNLITESMDENLLADSYGTFQELQDEIDAVEEGGTLNLTRNYKYEGGSNNGITINKPLTINGQDNTIYGNQISRIFVITSDNVVLNDINFINGSSYGAAIFASGYLTVRGCNFTSNACFGGGAIYVIGNLSIRGCNFLQNVASYDCSAIYVVGNLNVSDCNFVNNTAGNNALSSAIYVDGYLSVSNCNFVNNSAYPDSHALIIGAIYVDGNLTINNCNFINTEYSESHSLVGGSAIYVVGNLIVSNCNFVNNTAYPDSHALIGGAAIYVDGNLTVSGCNFTNNFAISLDDMGGGAIYVNGNSTVNDCKFTNNRASSYRGTSYGGAIYVNGNSTVGGCNFTNNYVLSEHGTCYGGAIYVNGNSTVGGCNFTNNYVFSYIGTNYGGAVYVVGNLTISNGSFTDNNGKNGGAIHVDGYLTIDDCNFTDNAASYTDGVDIYIDGYLTVNDCSFVNTEYINSSVIFLNKLSDINNSIFIIYRNSGNMTYHNVSKTILNEKNIVGGDSDYNAFNCTLIQISLDLLNIYAPDVTKDYGGSERLEITLTESDMPVANANVNINLNGYKYQKTTDSNGKAYLDLDLDVGNYDVVITYRDISTTSHITVNQISSKTTLSYVNNTYNNVTLIALINPSDVTGDVVFNVNGEDVSVIIDGGNTTYKLFDLDPGIYTVKATYNGDVNHKSSCDNISFNIEDKIEVYAPDLTKYYKCPERFIVTVKENNVPLADKNVSITLNGVISTKKTDTNGQVSMAINLNSGVYNVTSQYGDIWTQSTITVKSTVSGNNITKIFRNNTQYYATFIDTSGKTLDENTAVEFNINGVLYTRYTNDKGEARMNINLNPGEYIITAKNPNSTEMYTNVITVLPTIVENYNLTKYYRNASQYSFRLLDDEGNPIGAGVEVRLNINGVFYTRTSNATGYVNMNINLNPGEYIITAEHNGLMASNTIKVLPVIETKDLSMKYKDGSNFEAKILDGMGNPHSSQTVTFNINGVFYDRVSDENGIARLSINLMAGEYIITTTFDGLNAANKITISS